MNKISNINDLVKFCAPFAPVSHETAGKLELYWDLLYKWQKKINLVSSTTMHEAWHRHFADSAQLLQYIKPGSSIIDMGSGAGFPALVLGIMGCAVTVVESDQRKCAFMIEVARQTKINITVHNKRIEDVSPETFDYISARALASLDKLIGYAMPFIERGAKGIFLKGDGLTEELTFASELWHINYQVNKSLTDPQGSILLVEGIQRA